MEQNLKTKIIKNLEKIGIDKEYARVYIELWTKGPLTVVKLSRKLDLGRNIIYRILDHLEEINLVNKKKKKYGSEYEAIHYKNLKYIVKKKKNELEKAQKGLEKLFDDLPYLQNANNVSSNVIHYHGIDGLKQVNWNLVKTKDMYRVYEVSRLSNYLDKDFAEKLRMEWLRREIHSRDLTNDNEIKPHTNITEFTNNFSEYRYIDPKTLQIKTEIYVYNDIVTLLQYDTIKYDPKSIFCVEIYNKALAESQKQIYDIIWKTAKEFKIVDDRGRRVLKEKAENS